MQMENRRPVSVGGQNKQNLSCSSRDHGPSPLDSSLFEGVPLAKRLRPSPTSGAGSTVSTIHNPRRETGRHGTPLLPQLWAVSSLIPARTHSHLAVSGTYHWQRIAVSRGPPPRERELQNRRPLPTGHDTRRRRSLFKAAVTRSGTAQHKLTSKSTSN
jgi:hypothetical protein